METEPASPRARRLGRAPAAMPAAELAALRLDPRGAVREHDIVCLLCGRSFRQLTNTHLLSHGLTAAEYKRECGYNDGRALMCHGLHRMYADRAVRIGFASRIRRRPILADPALRRRGGTRSIRLEELLTRRDTQRRLRTRWSSRDDSGRFTAADPAR
jgi:ROS/MUCR transcriptional regulator protein